MGASCCTDTNFSILNNPIDYVECDNLKDLKKTIEKIIYSIRIKISQSLPDVSLSPNKLKLKNYEWILLNNGSINEEVCYYVKFECLMIKIKLYLELVIDTLDKKDFSMDNCNYLKEDKIQNGNKIKENKKVKFDHDIEEFKLIKDDLDNRINVNYQNSNRGLIQSEEINKPFCSNLFPSFAPNILLTTIKKIRKNENEYLSHLIKYVNEILETFKVRDIENLNNLEKDLYFRILY